MTIKRTEIRDKSGRTIGYLVNGRVIALANQQHEASQSLWKEPPSQQLTLDVPEEREDAHDGRNKLSDHDKA